MGQPAAESSLIHLNSPKAGCYFADRTQSRASEAVTVHRAAILWKLICFRAILSPEATVLKTIEPTALDRKRMDRIARSALPVEWLDDLTKKQIVIRGRGGVGKTVILFQMAYRAFDNSGMRTLVLTYNKALVADMRRTMALLGVPRHLAKGGIGIETVYALSGGS